MIDAEGGISEVVTADVTSEESVRRAVAQIVKLFGTIHILVNIGKAMCESLIFLKLLVADAVFCVVPVQLASEVSWAMQL